MSLKEEGVAFDRHDNSDYRYARIFIDECDSINIPNFPYLKSNFYWFVSATARDSEGDFNAKNTGFINHMTRLISSSSFLDFYSGSVCAQCTEYKGVFESSDAFRDFKTPSGPSINGHPPKYHCRLCHYISCFEIFDWGEVPHPPEVHAGIRGYYNLNRVLRAILRHPDACNNLSCRSTPEEFIRYYDCYTCEVNNRRTRRDYISLLFLFKSSPEYVAQSILLGEYKENFIMAKTTRQVIIANRAQDVIDYETLRMINSGNIMGAAESYGASIETEDDIVKTIKEDMESKIIKVSKRLKKNSEKEDKANLKIERWTKKIAEEQEKLDELEKLKAANEEPENYQENKDKWSQKIQEYNKRIKEKETRLVGLEKDLKEDAGKKTRLEERLQSLVATIEAVLGTSSSGSGAASDDEDEPSKPTEELDTHCLICLEKPEAATMVTCCKTFYCFKCISEWTINYGGACCKCKTKITSNEMVTVTKKRTKGKEPMKQEEGRSSSKNEIDGRELSKEEHVARLIPLILSQKKEATKILIFSEQDRTIDKITSILERLNVPHIAYRRTSGSYTSIKKYITGDIPVVVLNSVSHGAGLNLQITSDIILYHKMTPELEKQAIGRAQRPGRTGPLTVHRLCYEGEYF
jgi:hypothetical protein